MVAGVTVAVLHRRPDAQGPAPVVAVAAAKGEVTLDVATIGTVEPATTRELAFAVTGTVEAIEVRAGTKVAAGQTLAAVDDTGAADDVDSAEEILSDAKGRLTEAENAAASVTAAATTCATPTLGHLTAVSAAATAAPSVPAIAAACPTHGYPDAGNDPILNARQTVNRAGRAVAEARAALDGAVLKAPIAGTVVSVAGRVGDTVSSGRTFITLAGTSAMQVRADFPEADAGSLKVGQRGTVTLADHDDTLDVTVVRVDPVGTSDGTLVRYGAVLAFAAPPTDLLVGQSAQVTVRVGEATDVLRVPSTAVHDISGGSGTVLVRSGTGDAQRTVTVGLRGDQYTEVTDGLTAGEPVVRSW
ncbi:HlyD family efflux transporter periplasmic adaptor subunit [Actinoplanes oblitus]|uniref:HlyD family efflux transporter periplasmic adaptor subunit n=1 Tax=Actinoplanes oblitus TaxID=3040509 RepID=A0ABY8WLB8_9ACTN|nr:HlyD family efflux transporter periplasmic adaptor subunit [Actinoplanes oblitus]WIM98696.1 HlyD family efflux transporter periplasmic adaptor subunit [Actinoplanes oblitus]